MEGYKNSNLSFDPSDIQNVSVFAGFSELSSVSRSMRLKTLFGDFLFFIIIFLIPYVTCLSFSLVFNFFVCSRGVEIIPGGFEAP